MSHYGFFSLLLLYAEAAWLSTVKTALHKLRAPWGICVELNLKARLFSYCFFVLQMEGGRGSEGAIRCCRDSRVLLGSAAGSNRIHFSASAPSSSSSSSSPITASLRACDALIQPRSLLRQSEPGYCLMCHFIGDLESAAKRLLRMEKVHFCDATS